MRQEVLLELTYTDTSMLAHLAHGGHCLAPVVSSFSSSSFLVRCMFSPNGHKLYLQDILIFGR